MAQQHVISQGTYYLVFAALIVLTFVTMGVSSMPLEGIWHIVLGLVFAICKSVLVILFFMHVLYSDRLTWVVVTGGFFWLGILLVLTLTDYFTRPWLGYPGH